MLKNYLISSWRNLRKTKLYTIVNVLGLAVGMAIFLLILHFVQFERSYDRHIPDFERVYRVRYERGGANGHEVRFASCTPPAGPMIRERIPEVAALGRLLKTSPVIARDDIIFTESRVFYAEPQLFEILPLQLLRGDPLSVLAAPNKAFISQSMAKKYFGATDPLHQTLEVNRETTYEVVGIFRDPPANTHLKMDIILPWQNLADKMGPDYTENWGHTGTYTYIRIAPNASVAVIETKLDEMVEQEFGEVLREYKMYLHLRLQPVADIHLHSRFMQEYEAGGNGQAVTFLTLVAFFIIIIAWVNYVNLSTARSLTRAREVGLRKVVGARRSQLVLQFFTEIVIINLLALGIALFLIELAMPFFMKMTNIPAEYSLWQSRWFWYSLPALFTVGIILSGAYPVLAMTAFRPITVLKGKLGYTAKGIGLRRVLVVFQFSVAMMLISATLAISGQLRFMQQQDLGFNMDQILIFKSPLIKGSHFASKSKAFKETLLQSPHIRQICHVTEPPGRQIYWDAGGIYKAGGDESDSKNYQIVGIDYEFISLFDLEFVAGRNFSKEFGSDSQSLILNETAVKWIGFDSPEAALNQEVIYWGESFAVIGVLRDFHQQAPRESFEPHIYRFMPEGRGRLGNYAVKLSGTHIQQSIRQIEEIYRKFYPGNPFDFYFLDEYYNQQYQNDILIGDVFQTFAALALFITALGIFGLAYFNATQRTREISIRKVLGARLGQILSLLSWDFIIMIGISAAVATPLLYIGLQRYLNGFAQRMPLKLWLFLLPILMVSALTLLTIAVQTIKTALADPAKVLRYE